jgi:hypothetical protein
MEIPVERCQECGKWVKEGVERCDPCIAAQTERILKSKLEAYA